MFGYLLFKDLGFFKFFHVCKFGQFYAMFVEI